jgi:hypothetical protein
MESAIFFAFASACVANTIYKEKKVYEETIKKLCSAADLASDEISGYPSQFDPGKYYLPEQLKHLQGSDYL